MPRLRVIILERDLDTNGFRYVLWADVPTARQSFYAQPAGTKSTWKDALPADNDALVAGVVAERTSTQRVQGGTTITQIEGFLENRWSDFQAEVNASNPWQRFGSTWDGTTWTVANNG
jgi:hypothetical protein